MDWSLGRVSDEAELAKRAENRRMATEAILLQAAAGSIMAKEGGDHFKQLIEGLNGE